jgi:hypothetical protein
MLMLYIISLNSTYFTAYHLTKYAAQQNSHDTQHADRHMLMLYIISLNSTCCTAYHLTQHAANHNIMLFNTAAMIPSMPTDTC